MIVEKNKFKTHENDDQTVRKVVIALDSEKVCKTVKSHNLLTVCQQNCKRSFRKHIQQEFKTGKTSFYKKIYCL